MSLSLLLLPVLKIVLSFPVARLKAVFEFSHLTKMTNCSMWSCYANKWTENTPKTGSLALRGRLHANPSWEKCCPYRIRRHFHVIKFHFVITSLCWSGDKLSKGERQALQTVKRISTAVVPAVCAATVLVQNECSSFHVVLWAPQCTFV